MALLLSLVLRVTALAELDREQHPLLYSGGVSQEQCADGKLLVVSVPQSAPPCMWVYAPLCPGQQVHNVAAVQFASFY
ncbi:hypothetical protein AB1Y20_008799 [Prymnesium parvum]|uniref:Transmembrane 9 superfamily member n=1 Tax=Prymnesium parvum TaxID=97485 RepID=A0AB34ITE5_PRYPA